MAAVAIISPRPAQATFQFTIASELTGSYVWDAAVDPSSTTATVLYYLLTKPGLSSNPLNGGTTSFIGTLTNFSNGGHATNSFCAVVVASDTVSGIFDSSVIQCHSFLHASGGGNANSISRGDGNGGQIGFNQTWNLGYFIDTDAYMVVKVYPPSTTFVSDPVTGFLTPPPGAVPTATIVDGVPRSGELAGGTWENTEIWDSRNSSGTTVNNGIYPVFFSAYLQDGTTRYSYTQQIPVDIIRFTAFNTTGLSAVVPLGDINYSLNANANVRIVIAQPGRQFTIDGSGLVQSLNAAGTAIDTTTASVVTVLSGQRSAGANTETWNGTNSLGVAVSTGVYAVGVSATDGYSHQALNLSGNNGPLAGTIAMDRIPSQTAAGGAVPSVTAVSVGGMNVTLNGGTSVVAFSQINATLSAAGGPLTTVALTGPGGPIAGGIVTVSGTAIAYSTSSILSSTGAYTVTIAPYDPSGVAPGPVQVTPFLVAPGAGPSVTGAAINGTSLGLSTPTAIAPPFSAISITLSGAGGAGTAVALTGPLGPIAGSSVTVSGTAVTFTVPSVSTVGVYSVTINPIGSTGNVGPVSTIGFTVSASGAGGSIGTNAGFSSSVVSYPNPVKTAPAKIRFTVGLDTAMDIDIYTLTGRRILHQSQTYAASSLPQFFPWFLVNDSGGSVASGVYLVHLTATSAEGTTRVSKKIMVVK